MCCSHRAMVCQVSNPKLLFRIKTLCGGNDRYLKLEDDIVLSIVHASGAMQSWMLRSAVDKN